MDMIKTGIIMEDMIGKDITERDIICKDMIDKANFWKQDTNGKQSRKIIILINYDVTTKGFKNQ
jgi:hypothetical protein